MVLGNYAIDCEIGWRFCTVLRVLSGVTETRRPEGKKCGLYSAEISHPPSDRQCFHRLLFEDINISLYPLNV